MTQIFKVVVVIAVVAVCAIFAFRFQPTVQAQDNLTPGMLFGPLSVGNGEYLELCASNLGDGDVTAVVHFRNLTTSEVTANQTITIKSGGGACASYFGSGRVVGMARGDGRASDWVSPSNALIMAVISQRGDGSNGRTAAAVLGVPKLWLKGL